MRLVAAGTGNLVADQQHDQHDQDGQPGDAECEWFLEINHKKSKWLKTNDAVIIPPVVGWMMTASFTTLVKCDLALSMDWAAQSARSRPRSAEAAELFRMSAG